MCRFTLATFVSCRCQLVCIREACSAVRSPHHVCDLTDPIVSVEMNRACSRHANTITVLNRTEALFSSGDFNICEVVQHIATAYERATVSIPAELFQGEFDRDEIRRKISAARCHLIVRESDSVTAEVFKRYASSGTKLYITRCFSAGVSVNKKTAAKANKKNLHGVKSGRVGKKSSNKATACQEDEEDEEEVEERRRQEEIQERRRQEKIEMEKQRAQAAALKKVAANKGVETDKEKKKNGRATKTGGIRRKEPQVPTKLSAAALQRLERLEEEMKAEKQARLMAQREAERREREEREKRDRREEEERLTLLAYEEEQAVEAKRGAKRVAEKKARRERGDKNKPVKTMKMREEDAEAKIREEIRLKAEVEESQEARWEEAVRHKIEAEEEEEEKRKAAHAEFTYRWTPRRVENLKKCKREEDDAESRRPVKKQRVEYSRPMNTEELLEIGPGEKNWSVERRAKRAADKKLAWSPPAAVKAAKELADAQFALAMEQLTEDFAGWTLGVGRKRTPLPSTFSRWSGPLPYTADVPFSLPYL